MMATFPGSAENPGLSPDQRSQREKIHELPSTETVYQTKYLQKMRNACEAQVASLSFLRVRVST